MTWLKMSMYSTLRWQMNCVIALSIWLSTHSDLVFDRIEEYLINPVETMVRKAPCDLSP